MTGTAGSPHPHYQQLDFLRGIAALAVVGFHLSVRLDLPALFHRGYLAVDFFFVLSGFVIAQAYEGRLTSGAMQFGDFFLLRLIRLLPMVVLGTLLAAAVELYRPGEVPFGRHLADLGLATALGCLCVPILWQTTLEHTIFPLNTPVWSLFFELVANYSCVPIYRSLRARWLMAALAAVSLIVIALAIVAHGNADFGAEPQNFLLGFPRVAFSFCTGALLSRVQVRGPVIGKWVYAATLCVVFNMPAMNGVVDQCWDILAIAVVFPALVLAVANGSHSAQGSEVSRWSGNISYPLYAMHYPLVRVVGVLCRGHGVAGPAAVAVALAVPGLMAAGSAVVYRYYDVPVRLWLAARARSWRG